LFKVLKKILEVIFPSHCISCSEIVSSDGLFCDQCFPKLEFISDPKCQICSYPFEVELKHLPPFCGTCLAKKPNYHKVLTIYRYNETIAKSLSALKYSDQTFLAKKFSRILFTNFKEEIANCDIICAVPLHKKRLKERKFNQAVLIAKNLSKDKFIPDLLWRLVNTAAQVKLKKKEREKNLKKAFLVNKKYHKLIKGKKILLLDDVMTTGATVNNCAKTLKKFGAKEIIILTVAKAVAG
jgi:ComF family protein